MHTQQTALISVSQRHGILDVAAALRARNIALVATSGTYAYLTEHGIEAREVGSVTGFPELFEGRVKTLHPAIFGGLLADRDKPLHCEQACEHGIAPFSLLIVNLYPFQETVARPDVTLPEAIEEIDIGGVALIRAAAKNYRHVTVVTHPEQYPAIIAGEVDLETRRLFAVRAFSHTAEYDASISRYLEAGCVPESLPGSLTLTLPLAKSLRYGENPQSRAAFYLPREESLPDQLWGKELSYNNLLDLDATLRLLVRSPRGIALPMTSQRVRVAIVKHTVPCGVAEAVTALDAVIAALAADPVSAYGGIVALDAPVDLPTAERLADFFLEIVAAPGFDDNALALLKRKKNLRILRYPLGLPERLLGELRLRSALRGVLAEDDDPTAIEETWRVVSERQPTEQEWTDLVLAWDVVRHVKSNGAVFVKDSVTRGIGAGQTNRVSSVRIAGIAAADQARGAACASDGFFPFPDGLETAASYGCAAIIAPAGSIRDAEVIASADRHRISLVFSNRRYFLH